MRVEHIDEPVKVGAVFDGQRIAPKWFFWQGRKHDIESIHMRWRDRAGQTPLLFFTVDHQGNTYELSLNQTTLEWRLIKVAMEE